MLAGSELRGIRPWRPTNHASKLNKSKPVKDLSFKTKAGLELVCANNLEGNEVSHHGDHIFLIKTYCVYSKLLSVLYLHTMCGYRIVYTILLKCICKPMKDVCKLKNMNFSLICSH